MSIHPTRPTLRLVSGDVDETASTAPGHSAATRRMDSAAVNAAMHGLTASADPTAVFLELARLMIPALCDAVDARVVTGDGLRQWAKATGLGTPTSRGTLTGTGLAALLAGTSVLTRDVSDGRDRFTTIVRVAGEADEPGAADPAAVLTYVAELHCTWWDWAPGESHLAVIELMGRCAAGAVIRTQQRTTIRRQEKHLANLKTALDTNRTIGAAIGVLMTLHGLRYEEAFALMSATSQRLNQRVAELAQTVLYTGELPP